VSHFSVLVVGDDIENQMAPFDENRETPRYMARTRAQIVADGRRSIERYRDGIYAEYLADPAKYIEEHSNNAAHIRYLRDEFPLKLAFTDEEVYADEVSWGGDFDEDGNEWSESNPQGYWDYWRVGGRWAGHLPLRNGRDGHMEPLSWEWTDGYMAAEKPNAETHADRARKGDVNLEALDPTFAILHDGEWVARGEMGWFGALRDEHVPEEDWPKRWHDYVADLPDDVMLTVVDCHV
jgi:hypothetical protein